ncbi:poly(U)-specific 3'-to-5' RNA exonuclease [Neocucurbitaria cava]|uniref:U6 snRNA phosphodiesterase n=1 Tax=Neocucurbitaria cava TaxID=798079 RepID=A0A9W8YB97_9PLEO|nr:poly(U)-specific 3'-to-5' RNA exonuclease [Neocucurbitaria cava]
MALVQLVQYPDSDTDNDDDGNAKPAQAAPKLAVKRKRSEDTEDDLPPLPSAFHDLYSANARLSTSDDPSLHGGRKRAVPHIADVLNRHNETRTKKLPIPEIKPSLQSELGATLPLHVSLSRTLQIKTEDREAFLEALRSSLRRAAVRTFHFAFSSLKWVPNFQRNRWFLVLGIKKAERDELNRVLDACNSAAKDRGHPGLYTGEDGDGSMQDDAVARSSKRRKSAVFESETVDHSENFHVSIAWNLIEPDPEWISLVEGIDISKHMQSPQDSFDAVKARVGNTVHNIALANKRF